ncbi:MAG: DUF1648 domain-containing protein [Alphaproteobacteria bacterium]|nr:DUF1648 domain-containing protein [Alphaproteobacteria bacterium]
MRHFPLLCYLALYALAGAQLEHYWPQLPRRVATHFGGGGIPNGWMTKEAFRNFYLGFLLFLPGVMAGSGLLFRIMPPRLINLPHKGYWLAPERRAQTVGKLQRDMNGFSVIVAAFIVALHQLVIMANLAYPVRMDNTLIWALLGVMMAFILGFVIRQYRSFRLPEGAKDPAKGG